MHRKTDTKLIRRIIMVVSCLLLVVLVIYSCFSCAVSNNDRDVATPDEASTKALTSVTKDINKQTSQTAQEPTEQKMESIVPTNQTSSSEPQTKETTRVSQKKDVLKSQKKKIVHKKAKTTKTRSSKASSTNKITTPDITRNYHPSKHKPKQQPATNLHSDDILDGEFIN